MRWRYAALPGGPVDVQNTFRALPARTQLRAEARITLAPLVDVLPCLGAVTITLLDAPYVDLSLALIGGLDLMQLPGIHEAVQFIAHKVGSRVRSRVSKGFTVGGCDGPTCHIGACQRCVLLFHACVREQQ